MNATLTAAAPPATSPKVADTGQGLYGIWCNYSDRLATLRSLRSWASNDPVRYRDVEFLARHALTEFEKTLAQTPLANEIALPKGVDSFQGLAAALAQTRSKAAAHNRRENSIWRAAGGRLHTGSWRLVGRLAAVLVLILVVLYLLPDLLYPNRAVRLAHFQTISDALERYRNDVGHYPVSHNPATGDWLGIGWGGERNDWIPDLVPRYLAHLPVEPRNAPLVKFAQYLYRSDGTDYKVLILSPEDCAITIFVNPWLKDPVRDNENACSAYGVWTKGASPW